MKVKDIMTSEIYSINKQENIARAAQIMRESDIGALPVTDGERIVGVLTDRDIAVRNVAMQHNPEIPVEEVMTANIINCSPETTVEEASDLMAKYQVRRLPVIENGNLVGMVSLGDLATESRTDEEAGYTLSQVSLDEER
ncbi:CBS domain-containing protein [Natranaerofaba carboxydovora]|uniref:CBS domain-containing protein n=1 Tax=Natranaerofaba carboxydovora TaxID=2742683 RepID=UPI001F1474B2|nr:CBS domain-containing protein [Natranaerofaba carboxydovora]UMZ74151.1 Hypoxic response protein 1 [Natranaerofaba carboxydovora]